MSNIRAARIEEAVRSSGDWFFVDVGFSSSSKTCGFLEGDGQPEILTFAALRSKLVALVESIGPPANLVIEAPLSVAFNASGNPVGRSVELRNGQSRYWYVGLGCSVLVAATYLLRAVTDACAHREVRLLEGLVSFKEKGVVSSHTEDVRNLRAVVWGVPSMGRIVPAEQLATSEAHVLQSAFAVAGMNYGVPPVVLVGT
jgi:hypothetical protein